MLAGAAPAAMGENTAPGDGSQEGVGGSSASSKSMPLASGAADLLRDGMLHGHGPVRIYVTLENTRYLANAHGKEREICMRSLYIFDALGPVRQHIYWLVEWKWFENFVLFLIFFSSVNLAIYRYRDPDSPINDFIAICDPCLTVAFTLECMMKVIAYGLVLDRGTYLRNGWNWLDFVVVISGWLDELPSDSANLRFLLVFKVLRPLRSLTVMPQMRLLVNTVLQSMKRLTQFCLMVVFLFSVFSIVGLNFWAGVMYRQCRTTENPLWDASLKCWSWPPAEESSGRLCGGRYTCEAGHRCGSIYLDDPIEDMRPKFNGAFETPGRIPGKGAPWCQDTDKTWNSEDFNFHMTHFDHMPGALVVVFQCMTLEGWVDLMYMLQDADSDIVASLYFVILITATAFFLLNAALAIVTETFDDSFAGEEDDVSESSNHEASCIPPDDKSWAASRNAPESKGVEKKKDLCEVTVVKPVRSDSSEEGDKPDDDEDDFMDDVDWDDAPWWDVPVVRMFRAIASSEWFMNIVMVFILFNVVTMCLDKYPPPSAGMQSFLQVCNYIFAVAFTVEMIILVVAMGPKSYLLTVMTAFDGAIVIASWVEISMSGGGGAVRAFRGLRLLRIFKLAKKLVSLRVMLKAMWNTLASLGNLAVLLGLMIFIFTMMGRELFALKFHFDDNGHIMDDGDSPYCNGVRDNFDCVPRAHFDTFIWAFTTVFQILTGENWNAIMYDGMKKNILFIVYFILVMVFGQFIMLSLFVAVLMTKFEDARITQQAKEADKKRNSREGSGKGVASRLGDISVTLRETMSRTFSKTSTSMNEDKKVHPMADLGDGVSVLPGDTDTSLKPQPVKKQHRWIWYKHYAFFVLSPDNPVRVACRVLVENKRFDQAVLVCICISSLAMALDQPMADPEAALTQILYWMGFVFTVVFTIEMFLKMIAFGCLYGQTFGWNKRAYWLQPWNVLDGVVVIVSVLDIVTQGKGALGAMKTLRIVRALRPLRVVARFENLRLVVQTLFKSVPALFNVAVVGVLVFLIFALVFCNYLKGTFYACMGVNDGELEGFKFDSNVTYVNGTNGLMPAFNSNGDFMNLSSAQMANLIMDQPTPLCLNVTSGILTPLGRRTENGRWLAEGACPVGQVQTARATKDSPICVGSCNARFDKATARCPAPPKEASDLPSFCSGAPVTSYYKSLIDRDIMFCGTTPSAPDALSCSQAFCPDGCPDLADGCDDRKATCRDNCKAHQNYCTTSCEEGKEGTQDCILCREQCEAACQCQEFCQPFIKDAGTCVEQGGRWLQALSQDFDNILSSFLTLVEIATTEGWVDVMYQAVDAVEPYMEPIRDHQELWAIAFMFFIFVSFFFYINLCVGVIVDNYNAIKGDASCLLTKEQMDWIATHRSLHKRTVFYPLTNLHMAPFLQVRVYRFIVHPYFENFIMFCIVGNTLSMGLKIFPEPSKEYEDAREILNWMFGGIFFVEMVLKLFAFRLNYFRENWNIFDFACVMSTLAGLIISLASDLQMATAMSAIRAFRIARLFRLVRFLKGLNRMFTALVLSLPKLINVGAILLLFFFLFSVLGVQLFAKTKFHGPHGIHANFRDPGRAFLTLIRSVTGEGWNEIMHALSRDMTYYTQSVGEMCIDEDLLFVDKSSYPILKEKCLVDNPNACGKDLSYIYFLIFTAVMTMVMVNLMIAVILEAFTDSASSDLMQVIDYCVRKWPKYDTNLCLKLPIGKVLVFAQDVAEAHGVEFDALDTPASMNSSPSSKDRSLIFQKKVEERMVPELSEFSHIDRIPMKVAKLCHVKVLKDGHVHFLYAVRMAVAVTLAHNSLALMSDFEEAESADERLQSLRNNQVNRCMRRSEVQESMSLEEQVGAAKIQGLFRMRKAWKQAQLQKRQKSAALREEEVKDEAAANACEETPPGLLPHQLTPREAG